MEKLSSGYRINNAGDDAAGLQLSENLEAQVRGDQKAEDNVQDAVNMLNVVDGAYQTITDQIQRIRELGVEGANATYSTTQKQAMIQEINQLILEKNRVADATNFDGVPLMDGSINGFPSFPNQNPFMIQVGANANDVIDISGAFGDAAALAGFGGNLTFPQIIDKADTMLQNLDTMRGNLGAYVDRLQGVEQNLSINVENLQAADARIRDVDVAAESANLTQAKVLQQSAALVLSQANQTPSLALQLLKGQ